MNIGIDNGLILNPQYIAKEGDFWQYKKIVGGSILVYNNHDFVHEIKDSDNHLENIEIFNKLYQYKYIPGDY